MTLLRPAPVSTDRFTYDVATRTFVAEVSGLSDLRLGRVWDDACDEGLTLVSSRTGREIVFAAAGETRDADGDIVSWNFTAVRADYRVRIFND